MGKILLRTDISKTAKASPESGKTRVISTTHQNFSPFLEFPHLQLRYNLYVYNNSAITIIDDDSLLNVERVLGENLSYIYRTPTIIDFIFNPDIELGPSRTGKSIIVAKSSNKFSLLNKNVQFNITVFHY